PPRRTPAAGGEAAAPRPRPRLPLGAAADRAASLGARAQARACVEQARAVTPDPAGRAAVLEQAGREAAAANERARWQAFFDEAIALYLAQGDRRAACRTTTELVRNLLPRERDDAAP